MKRSILFVAALFGIIPLANSQDSDWLNHSRVDQWNSRIPITVTNSQNFERENVPVVVSIDELQISGDDFAPGNFYVYDHRMDTTPLYQVDVPEGGDMKEIVFLASLKAGEQKSYHVYYSENGQAWPQQERFTQATNMPGWESELFGYRSYGPFVIDLFARDINHPGLMLHHFYNGDNVQIYNYHKESDLGLDILLSGSTAGLAGIGLYVNGQATLVGEPFESEVIASGPVRSIVRMHMEGWQTDHGDVSITRRATIYAHHYETQIQDRIEGLRGDLLYAVGIRKVEDAQTDFVENRGLFLQWQNQGAGIGEAGLGLYVKPEKINRVVEDEGNHFVLFKPPVDEALTFWAFGAWKNGGAIDNFSDFQQRAEQIRQLQKPLVVQTGEMQYPSEGRN